MSVIMISRSALKAPAMWAAAVSITTVSGFSTISAASIAAPSGRQRKATSARFRNSRRAASSFRSCSGMDRSSRSFRSASRSQIRRPVVPALPSINTLVISGSPWMKMEMNKYAIIIHIFA